MKPDAQNWLRRWWRTSLSGLVVALFVGYAIRNRLWLMAVTTLTWGVLAVVFGMRADRLKSSRPQPTNGQRAVRFLLMLFFICAIWAGYELFFGDAKHS